MTIGRSAQYGTAAIFPDGGETADDIIRMCREAGAIVEEDGECFVVALRPRIGPELWTETALRKSFR